MRVFQRHRIGPKFASDTRILNSRAVRPGNPTRQSFARRPQSPTIRAVQRSRGGPGIVKAKRQPLQVRRRFELIHSSDDRIRELFERADVISEGAVREEMNGRCYYGTTSVLLPSVAQGGLIPDEQRAALATQLQADPHARLRAIRIACREAQVRCGAILGRLRAEVTVLEDHNGVRFDVDVEVQVLEARKIAGD